MNYNVDYFIDKFSKIPDELWLIQDQGAVDNVGAAPHCAIGWCKNTAGNYGSATAYKVTTGSFSEEALALHLLFKNNGITSKDFPKDDAGHNVAELNNGENPRYQQDTPKARILAALYDIKKQQQPVKELPAPKMQFEKYEKMAEKTELIYAN